MPLVEQDAAVTGPGPDPASRTALDLEPCSGHPAYRVMCTGGTRKAERLRDGQGSGQARAGASGPH